MAEGNLFLVRHAPNPFRNDMSIEFTLPAAGHVVVEIFGADGRRVTTLADDDMAAGPHAVRWNAGKDAPSGMYFYKVRAGANTSTGKMVHVD